MLLGRHLSAAGVHLEILSRSKGKTLRLKGLGGTLVLFPYLTQCSQAPRGSKILAKGGAPLPPPPWMKPCAAGNHSDRHWQCIYMYVLPLSSAVSGGGNEFTNSLSAILVTVVCHNYLCMCSYTSHSYYWRLTFRASQLYCSKVAVGTLLCFI